MDIDNNHTYINPLNTRYSSKEMQKIFSNCNKYTIWRQLWTALAKAEKSAGLPITDEQINELEANINNLNLAKAEQYEKETNHEVMAHIKAYGEQCPKAAAIIHLGETSAFVIDNSDIIIYKQGLELTKQKLLLLIKALANFSNQYKEMPTLSYTHLQVAQPTTVGKRASLWLSSFIADFYELIYVIDNLKLRGVKGTTGTAASFAKLLNNDYQKYQQIDNAVAQHLGFSSSYLVTSQTYDRKIDITIANVLGQMAVSAHKISNDLRLLQHLSEIEEPFSKTQVGSSAMPYKRNPMLSERVSALSKFIMSLQVAPNLVASTQWLERTLDDSANKRLSLPQMFLSIDSVLMLLTKIISNCQVNEKVIEQNLAKEVPFLITENILMEYVKNGGDRQEGHEKIRKYAIEAANRVKEQGLANNLVENLINDKDFLITKEQIEQLANPKQLIGFCREQVANFLELEVYPLIAKYS
ncbi:adenylosuccinate lyase [Rickettsiales bacterium LUAb2]